MFATTKSRSPISPLRVFLKLRVGNGFVGNDFRFDRRIFGGFLLGLCIDNGLFACRNLVGLRLHVIFDGVFEGRIFRELCADEIVIRPDTSRR